MRACVESHRAKAQATADNNRNRSSAGTFALAWIWRSVANCEQMEHCRHGGNPMVGELRGHLVFALVFAPFAGHRRHEELGRVDLGVDSRLCPVVRLYCCRH